MSQRQDGVLVGIGGAIGASLRVGVGVAAVALLDDAGLWASTLLVNVVGAFLLGIAAARPLREPTAAFLRTGLLGAFTTFSTIALLVVDLADMGAGVALAYLLGTTALGLLAVRLGAMLGGRAVTSDQAGR